AGRDQPDITGLIGQYAHGNEPSHHMAYLYNYLGQRWRSQALVHQIMDEQYRNAPDGLSGNEDCGQMSAWYLFSALGFYPVTPGTDYYVIGSPRVTHAELPFDNGNTLTISVKEGGPDRRYIQSVTWNGEPYEKTYLLHRHLLEGGTLEFTMGEEPSATWGVDPASWPPSSVDYPELMPVPALAQGKRAFQFRDTIALNHPVPGTEMYFTVDGSDPADSTNTARLKYTLPFQIEETTTLKAVAVHPTLGASDVISTKFLKIPSDWSITIGQAYSEQYTAGGDQALIDGLRGGPDFKTGEWQGYHGVDMEVVVDLGSVREVSTVAPSFLQDENSWIFFPTEVEVWISRDETEWESLGTQTLKATPRDPGTILEAPEFRARDYVRYVKVKATNMGTCPEWHKGAGGKSWIFTDEIVIN
ncbi:MAG TPA: glycosyl hydrolase family 92, partial [Cytophagales bacterium]|nr:glycosyl hydrolase family 92 [Cytophagales bacterium]